MSMMTRPTGGSGLTGYIPVRNTNSNAQLDVYELANIHGQGSGYRPYTEHLRKALHHGPGQQPHQKEGEQDGQGTAELENQTTTPVETSAEGGIDGYHLVEMLARYH